MSSRKRKGYGSVQTSFSLEDADKCKARPTARCPVQDDAERQRIGTKARHTPKPHRAAADAHLK